MHQNVDRDQNMMNGINEDSRYRIEKHTTLNSGICEIQEKNNFNITIFW